MERPAPLDRLLTPIFLSLFLSLSFCSLVCKPALPRGENKTTRERKRGGDEREVRATRKQSFSPLPSFRSSSPLSSVSSSSSSSLVPTLLLLYATSTTPCNIYEIGDLSPTTESSSPPLALAPSASSLARKVRSRFTDSFENTAATLRFGPPLPP